MPAGLPPSRRRWARPRLSPARRARGRRGATTWRRSRTPRWSSPTGERCAGRRGRGCGASSGSPTPRHRSVICAGGRPGRTRPGRDPGRDRVRQLLPAGRVACSGREHERGLPVPERLHASRRARREGRSGDGLDPRRRARLGRVERLSPRRARRAERRRRDHQLPARRARLPRAPVLDRRVSGSRLGQLRIAGSAVGAPLGTAEHRSLRRRSAQRHALRRVGRRAQRSRTARLADCPRPVPASDRRKRRLRRQPAVSAGGRGGRHGVRGPGRLQRHGRGLPAPGPGRDAAREPALLRRHAGGRREGPDSNRSRARSRAAGSTACP